MRIASTLAEEAENSCLKLPGGPKCIWDLKTTLQGNLDYVSLCLPLVLFLVSTVTLRLSHASQLGIRMTGESGQQRQECEADRSTLKENNGQRSCTSGSIRMTYL